MIRPARRMACGQKCRSVEIINVACFILGWVWALCIDGIMSFALTLEKELGVDAGSLEAVTKGAENSGATNIDVR